MKYAAAFGLYLLISMLFLNAIAQDKLIKMDGSEQEVKVLEIKPDLIKYKRYSNLSGPTYEALRSTIHKVVYQNGESEIFTPLSKDGKTGIVFSFIGGDTLKVTHVLDGSGAAEIGILPGDKIIAIGAIKVGSFASEGNVNNLLNGPVGSSVEVTIVRARLKTALPFLVERRLSSSFMVQNNEVEEDVQTNLNTSESQRYTESQQHIEPKKNTYVYDKGGFYISVSGGGGGTNMRGGSVGIFEAEIGDFINSSQTTVGAKFGLFSLTGPEYNLFFVKYNSTRYMGNHAKSGFHIGGDVGMAFYPDGDQPLWDVALTMGYGLRVIQKLRIEFFGNFELMPTVTFSNLGIIGWGGVRVGGIF